MRRLVQILATCVALLWAAALTSVLSAAERNSTAAGGYLIHHSVFNSGFLKPEIAAAHGLIRGANRALVNVAVTRVRGDGEGGGEGGGGRYGLPVAVAGEARNLMQQVTRLDFIEIREAGATYYLAPFKFADREILHFHLQVRLPEESRARSVRFTRTLYRD
ncbi:MAG: DUF4426 domain-containing protein [Cellvibrionales bacterium]|nr:DUF4426 domain-containing protein [Cellvibrionales bacterium]